MNPCDENDLKRRGHFAERDRHRQTRTAGKPDVSQNFLTTNPCDENYLNEATLTKRRRIERMGTAAGQMTP